MGRERLFNIFERNTGEPQQAEICQSGSERAANASEFGFKSDVDDPLVILLCSPNANVQLSRDFNFSWTRAGVLIPPTPQFFPFLFRSYKSLYRPWLIAWVLRSATAYSSAARVSIGSLLFPWCKPAYPASSLISRRCETNALQAFYHLVQDGVAPELGAN